MAMDTMKTHIAAMVLLAGVSGCAAHGTAPYNTNAMVGLSVEECLTRYGLTDAKSWINPRSAEPRSGPDGEVYFTLTTLYYLPEGDLALTDGKGVVVQAVFFKDARPIEQRLREQQKRWSEFVEKIERQRRRP